MHLNFYNAVASAVFAAPAFNVEAKTPRRVTAQLSLRGLGEQFPDGRKNSCVSSRVGARRAPDGRLIDNYGFIQQFNTLYIVVAPRYRVGAHQTGAQFFSQD